MPKCRWGPVDPPVDPPVVPEKVVIDEDGPVDIEIDGIKYRVYKKFGSSAQPTSSLTYYKAEDGRTIFEANGWNITVVSEDNTTGDGKYTDVVVKGNRNTFFGSNSEDSIEIQGDNNDVHGDINHKKGGDDNVTITSGKGNYVYGESGSDEVTTKTDGNFFNAAILDVEVANGEIQDLTPPEKPSNWKDVTAPNASQNAQMAEVKKAFGLPDNATFKKVQQNGSTMGLSYNSQAYLSTTDANGKIKTLTKKDDGVTLAKVEYTYDSAGKVASTKMIDYQNNTITITDAKGNKTTTKYDNVKLVNPTAISSTIVNADGTKTETTIDKENNTKTTKNADGTTTVETFGENNKVQKSETKDKDGKVTETKTYDYENDTVTTVKADGSKVILTYDDVTVKSSIQSEHAYDKDGNLTSTTAYKNQKVDMTFPEGDIMTVKDFFKQVDINKDNKLTEDEIKTLYNKTTDPVIKGILSNFTDGNGVTFAFKLAATGSGLKAYESDSTMSLDDATAMISNNGTITSAKISELQAKAAYASLVGYEEDNSWYVNKSENKGAMTTANPAYSLTNENGTKYDDLTMVLLNSQDGNSINRKDLEDYGFKTAADFQNKELFKQLRTGADILAAIGFETSGWGFKDINAEDILKAYNGTNDENVKRACILTGLIEVDNDGIARVANGKTNESKFDGNVRDFYRKVLIEIVGYANLKKPEEAEA